MKLDIKYQDSFSRGELLLRTLFGGFYIVIPHFFVMIFVSIWAAILSFLAFWVVLFTGKYPKNWFDFQVKLMNWGARVSASLSNLIDGYPAIGINGTSDKVSVNVTYPETISRGLLLLRLIFGAVYVSLPHMFCLGFRMLWGGVLGFFAWWAILFTGKYPKGWFDFQVGSMRWSYRYGVYMSYMGDTYPPFSGKE
jgi:hypothetical protein